MMARTRASKGSQRSERELRAVQLYQDHVNPSLAMIARFSACDRIEVRGTGALVYDSSGREYVDCVGGFGALAAGHAHPRIVRAMTEQLSRLGVSTKVLLNEPMIQLAAALAEITPGDLQYSFFINSGTEAVEAALKVARLATGRPGVVFASGGFHGKTLAWKYRRHAHFLPWHPDGRLAPVAV